MKQMLLLGFFLLLGSSSFGQKAISVCVAMRHSTRYDNTVVAIKGCRA